MNESKHERMRKQETNVCWPRHFLVLRCDKSWGKKADDVRDTQASDHNYMFVNVQIQNVPSDSALSA